MYTKVDQVSALQFDIHQYLSDNFRMKFPCFLFSLWLFFHGINVEGVTLYPPNLGGGQDGTNGDEFLTGTADVSLFSKTKRIHQRSKHITYCV